MKKDEFERLNEIATEMEATAQTKGEELQMEAIRCGLGILKRFLVVFEKIAAVHVPVERDESGYPRKTTVHFFDKDFCT